MVEQKVILFSDFAVNTALAATASEIYQSSTTNTMQYAQFNHLYVKNRDAVAYRVSLDGDTTNARFFDIAAGDTLILEKEDGFFFNFLKATNLHASTAGTAGTLLVRWSRVEYAAEAQNARNISGSFILPQNASRVGTE